MNGIGKGIDALIGGLVILVIVAVPLALWKLFDIAVWIYHHVNINVS